MLWIFFWKGINHQHYKIFYGNMNLTDLMERNIRLYIILDLFLICYNHYFQPLHQSKLYLAVLFPLDWSKINFLLTLKVHCQIIILTILFIIIARYRDLLLSLIARSHEFLKILGKSNHLMKVCSNTWLTCLEHKIWFLFEEFLCVFRISYSLKL
jgi:hypothetical protein